jgi:glucose-6-phosphate 1-dehydrogenase
VDNVQITVAEDIGVEHRSAFYERTGVVRDILQNHLLQLVALVAMEPPIGFEPELIRDEKVKVFRSIRPLDASSIDAGAVRGQYAAGVAGGLPVPGYREEPGIATESWTPTFVAARLVVANWRWAGVPFYVRTGKRLARRVTEICVQFRQPPLRLFGRSCDVLEPNVIVLTIQPEEGIRLRFGVKSPGSANQIAPVTVRFSYHEAFTGFAAEPYGKLLLDCMRGDLTLFERQDGVEAMWDVVDPLVARWEALPPPDFPNYRAGTWGPAAADELLGREGRRWLTQ